MRTGLYGCGVVLCCGLLFAAGCSKEDLVKKDEPLVSKTEAAPAAPTATPAPAAPATSVAPDSSAKTVTQDLGAKAAGTTVVEEKPATSTKGAAQLVLENIYFDFDSAVLSDLARTTLNSTYDLLKKNGFAKLEIEGHCDERGSDEYNLALGDQRANAAKHYLTNLGIKAERLVTISYGKEKPVNPGHNEEAWAMNRRDVFVIVK